jgi:hypothetical protein
MGGGLDEEEDEEREGDDTFLGREVFPPFV